MFESCLQKQASLKALFSDCKDNEAKYKKIIELGKKLPPLGSQFKMPERLVRGCQSRMYLYSHMEGDRIVFEAESDALISAGLAALLVYVYSDEPVVAILGCPPVFLKELGIPEALSPSRSNGLYSLYLRMQADARGMTGSSP